MASKPKKRAKADAARVAVPQSAGEANTFIDLIGQCQRQLAVLQTEQDEQIARIKANTARQAEPYLNEVRERTEGLRTWCEAHRVELTGAGRTKTVRFSAGEVSWRLRPPSVTIRGVEAVIEQIRDLRLFQFLRTRVEVDKEAMLREPDAVAAINGVTVGSAGEDFIVTPAEAPIADVAEPEPRAAE